MHTIDVAGYQVDTRHWIDGQRVVSLETFDDVSPVDGSLLGKIQRATKLEADWAVTAAKMAFPAWSAMTAQERGEILLRLADLVDANIEMLSQVETMDNGSLLRSHRRGVMPRVAKIGRAHV